MQNVNCISKNILYISINYSLNKYIRNISVWFSSTQTNPDLTQKKLRRFKPDKIFYSLFIWLIYQIKIISSEWRITRRVFKAQECLRLAKIIINLKKYKVSIMRSTEKRCTFTAAIYLNSSQLLITIISKDSR